MHFTLTPMQAFGIIARGLKAPRTVEIARLRYCVGLSRERTFEIRLPEGRVVVRYRGRPEDLKFSVMLQTRTADGWHTVCLIDNAEGKGTHIHRYSGTQKLPAQTFDHGTAREGIPAACEFLRERARDILKAWYETG